MSNDAQSADSLENAQIVRMTAFVHGYVQGVGFRWFTRAKALELGLVGSADNLRDGRVEIIVEGRARACAQLLAWLRSGQTPGTADSVVEQITMPRHDLKGFNER